MDPSNRSATRWKPQRRYLRRHIPAELSSWLLDPASLTLRLQQLCSGTFRVRVVSQAWGRPCPDEARALGVDGTGRAIIRQVQLLCDQRPWIFARTVIPAVSLRGRLQRLAHLGTRPLGAMLFADPGMQRGVVELARILPGQALFEESLGRVHRPPPEIWGRRSVFRLADKPLLVSEVFLPGFPARRERKPLWRTG